MATFSFSSSISEMIDTLNDVVFVQGNDSADAVNELSALVYANKFFNHEDWDKEYIPFYAKMFFKYYDMLDWKSEFVKRVHRKMESTISSLL